MGCYLLVNVECRCKESKAILICSDFRNIMFVAMHLVCIVKTLM
jgi:hypothetical protein